MRKANPTWCLKDGESLLNIVGKKVISTLETTCINGQSTANTRLARYEVDVSQSVVFKRLHFEDLLPDAGRCTILQLPESNNRGHPDIEARLLCTMSAVEVTSFME